MQPKLHVARLGDSDLPACDVHPRPTGQTWDAGPQRQCPHESHHRRSALMGWRLCWGLWVQQVLAVLMQGLRHSISKPQSKKRPSPQRPGAWGGKCAERVSAGAGKGSRPIWGGGQRGPGIQTTGCCSSLQLKRVGGGGGGGLAHEVRRGQGVERPRGAQRAPAG